MSDPGQEAVRIAESERRQTLSSLQFLSEASAIMGASLDYRHALRQLASLAVRDFADFCTCGLVEDGYLEIVARGLRDQGLVAEPEVRYPLATLPDGHPVAETLRTGAPVTVVDTAGNSEWAQSVSISSAQQDFIRALNLDMYILAPIAGHSRIFGVLGFGFRHADDGRRAPGALAFVSETGRRVGAAIDNALLHQAVSLSEARYRALSETMPQLVWSCRPDGYCVYLSPQWVEYTGIPVEQHLGWNWNRALHPDDRDPAIAAWHRAVEGQAEYDIEYRMRRRDGAFRWFKARGVPLLDDSGAVIQWFGTSTDIHDQKESRERLNAALTASRTGTFRWNIVTNELDWDENLDRLFGLPPGRTARALQQFVAMVHPDDRAGVLERCARCAAEAADFDMEFRVVWPDGSIHWLYDRGETFVEDGRPVYMTGACVDVTARVEVEQQVRESERLFRDVLDAMPQMVWTADPNGVADYLNTRWTAFTGQDLEAAQSRAWEGIFHPDDLPETSRRWLHSLATGEPFEAEHRIRSSAGEYRWFLTRGVRLRNSQLQTVRWFGTSTDITDQKNADEERRNLLRREQAARAEAEAAASALAAVNEELQHFVYAASHDLQSPLRTMAIYSELLKKKIGAAADSSTRDYLEFLNGNAKRLSRLLDELLAYAKLGSDPVEAAQVVDLHAVLDSVTSTMGMVLETKQAEVVSGPLPSVLGSGPQLAEVLQNLISNAVKYSRPGVPPRIRITAVRDGSFCQVSVEDNGEGFDPVYSDAIFKVFKRLHGSSIEGSGIGLSICRRIIQRHGGRIWAESVPGKGSIFHFTVPAGN